LTGRTRIHQAGIQQAESIFAISVGTAWRLVLSAHRYARAVQTDRGWTTICVIVDLAVAVVVLAIADLSGRPHAPGAHPAVRTVAGKVPRAAFALNGGAGRKTGRIAFSGRRDDAIVDNSIAVVVFPVAHLGRGPDIVAHDLPVHTGALALSAFTHRTATSDANPGHVRVRVVNNTVAVIVNAVADLGRGAERVDRTHHVRPGSVADVVSCPLARLRVARLAQVGEVLIHAAIAVVVLAVA
jgi:hypothetical protein